MIDSTTLVSGGDLWLGGAEGTVIEDGVEIGANGSPVASFSNH